MKVAQAVRILMAVVLGLGATIAWASGSCTSQNITVNVVLAPGSNGLHLIYGDSDFGTTSNTYNNPNDAEFNGGTVYPFGTFNLCSGSNDLTLNLTQTGRSSWASFTQQLSPPDAGGVNLNGNVYGLVFFNVRAAYTTPLGGSLNTCLQTQISPPSGLSSETWALRFEDPSTYASSGGVCETNGSGLGPIVNKGGNTSLVVVQHPDACTWLVHPQVDAFGFYRGGVAETIKRTTYSGGQYNLPWAMKLVLGSCM
jgi:hypothetical protein